VTPDGEAAELAAFTPEMEAISEIGEPASAPEAETGAAEGMVEVSNGSAPATPESGEERSGGAHG